MKSPARGRNVMAMRIYVFATVVARAVPATAHAQSGGEVNRALQLIALISKITPCTVAKWLTELPNGRTERCDADFAKSG
ncbi:hypothetical protein ACTGJ9_027040 [Bradyrhizobium sp. RDM12]